MAKLIDPDVARKVPYAGKEMTSREKSNVIGVNMVWNVADDLDRAQAQFKEYATLATMGDQPSARWAIYWLERLSALWGEKRDKLMAACRILAEANGVRFRPCAKGIPALRGKDGYMDVQYQQAMGIADGDISDMPHDFHPSFQELQS